MTKTRLRKSKIRLRSKKKSASPALSVSGSERLARKTYSEGGSLEGNWDDLSEERKWMLREEAFLTIEDLFEPLVKRTRRPLTDIYTEIFGEKLL